jgi:iron complex transport system substrate-binding protein
LALAKRPLKPTTLSGAFQDQWYVPQGESWAALYKRCPRRLFMADKGTGGLSSLEVVLEKATSRFWIALEISLL